MRYCFGAAFAVAFAASVTPAMADHVLVGQLDCRGASQQFVVGSVTNLECRFRPSSGARPHFYVSQIKRFGLDVGFNQSTVLLWSVFAKTRSVPPGGLSGTYVGGSANITVGVGIGANALFGGSNSTIALQPVSGQGQIGLGVVGGVSAMEVRPAEPPRGRRHRGRG